MKVLVFGVEHSHGRRKSDDSAYEICQLAYGVQVQGVSSDRRTVRGGGYREQTINLDPQALSVFLDKKLPAVLDIKVEADPSNLRRNLCVGVNE